MELRSVVDTEGWERTLRNSHGLLTRFSVVDPVSGASEALVTVGSSGSVTQDATSAVRGRCNLEIGLTPDTVPSELNDLLLPYGNELFIEQGVTDFASFSEYVPLGYFLLHDCEIVDEGGMLSVQVQSYDRAQRVAEARFEEPFVIADGTNVVTAISEVLLTAVPWLTLSFPAVSLTTKELVAEEGSDPWVFAQSIAASAGLDLYFGSDGVCYMTSGAEEGQMLPFEEGDDGLLIGARSVFSREGVYNKVIAEGEAREDGVVPRGTATDTDPFSPTYYYGKFGHKPLFYNSPFIATDTSAGLAATSRLAKVKGLARQVKFKSVPDVRLEPGDRAQIRRERLGIDESHTVNIVTIPVGLGTMECETRLTQAAAA